MAVCDEITAPCLSLSSLDEVGPTHNVVHVLYESTCMMYSCTYVRKYESTRLQRSLHVLSVNHNVVVVYSMITVVVVLPEVHVTSVQHSVKRVLYEDMIEYQCRLQLATVSVRVQ